MHVDIVSICRFNSCEVGKLQFNDEKIQFSTSVLSRYLYGLGEHQKTFLIDTHNHSHNFVFWSRDQPPKVTLSCVILNWKV